MIHCCACKMLYPRVLGVSACPHCKTQQLVLHAGSMPHSYDGEVRRIEAHYHCVNTPAPWLVRQPGFAEKNGYNEYMWGSPWIHMEGKAISTWYLIYPLSRLKQNQYLYHGTRLKAVPSIKRQGLLAAAHGLRQAHGLGSEREFRYVGLDRHPAEVHSKGSVVELHYDGWIAYTGFPIGTSAFCNFFQACRVVGADVHAIRYFEDGNSVAFAFTAQEIRLAPTQYNRGQLVRSGLKRCGLLRFLRGEDCGDLID